MFLNGALVLSLPMLKREGVGGLRFEDLKKVLLFPWSPRRKGTLQVLMPTWYGHHGVELVAGLA